jgi:hypothetical protein
MARRAAMAAFAPELVATVLPFLNGETQVKSWAEVVAKK